MNNKNPLKLKVSRDFFIQDGGDLYFSDGIMVEVAGADRYLSLLIFPLFR